MSWPIRLLLSAAIVLICIAIPAWRKDEKKKWREPVPPDDWMNDGR